jgi:CobQ-like glutamine amidotransferase family enzyme
LDVALDAHEPADDPKQTLAAADLLLGGGGQDSGQGLILDDLHRIGPALRALVADGAPMLMICGLYQLFGHCFRTADGAVMNGLGVFDAETTAGPSRLIGNITIRTEYGLTVGYENHSGLTTLGDLRTAFGRVVVGAGNNGRDGTEGARTGNAFGSYLHGPILPKNPALADALLALAVGRRGAPALAPRDDEAAAELRELDEIAARAHQVASRRPR